MTILLAIIIAFGYFACWALVGFAYLMGARYTRTFLIIALLLGGWGVLILFILGKFGDWANSVQKSWGEI
jgi:tetrahydromethanopterin S-methyltransferase subunit E